MGHWGKSVPCVLAPYSSIGHKELILPINEISTTNGDVLTNCFQDEYIHTNGGTDRSKGFGGYMEKVPQPAADIEVIHGGWDVGHCLKGCLSPPGATEAGLGCGLRDCRSMGFCMVLPSLQHPTPPLPQPSLLQGLV